MSETIAPELSYLELIRELLEGLQNDETETVVNRVAVEIRNYPDAPELYFIMGLASVKLGEEGRALAFLKQAHELDPERYEYAEALANLNTKVGNLSDGVYFAKLSTVLEPHPEIEGLLPDYLTGFYNAAAEVRPSLDYARGVRFADKRDFKEAEIRFLRELRLNPDHLDCLLAVGKLYQTNGLYKEALGVLSHGVKKDMNNAEFRYWLGEACYEIGEIEEGVLQHREALKLDPDSFELSCRIAVRGSCLTATHPDEARLFLDAMHERAPLSVEKEPPAPAPLNGRRLVIGYLTNATHHCEETRFLSDFLGGHNKTRCEVHLYEDSVSSDEMTKKLRELASQSRKIQDLDDEVVALIMKNDGLDVLIDATISTEPSRPQLFLRSDAPMRVCWPPFKHGFPLPGINSFLAYEHDVAALPAVARDSIHLVAAPLGVWTTGSQALSPLAGDAPIVAKGAPTFGMRADLFNYTPQDFEEVANILRTFEGSGMRVLWGPKRDEEIFARIRRIAADHGVEDCFDWDFVEPLPDGKNPGFFASVDIFLEFGRRTDGYRTAEALIMGVPVVSHRETCLSGLIASGVLMSAANGQLSGETRREMTGIIEQLVSDPDSLAALRKNLRGELHSTPLTQPLITAQTLDTFLINRHEELAGSTGD